MKYLLILCTHTFNPPSGLGVSIYQKTLIQYPCNKTRRDRIGKYIWQKLKGSVVKSYTGKNKAKDFLGVKETNDQNNCLQQPMFRWYP